MCSAKSKYGEVLFLPVPSAAAVLCHKVTLQRSCSQENYFCLQDHLRVVSSKGFVYTSK